MRYFLYLLLLFVSFSAQAKEIRTYGIIQVMPWQDDLIEDCRYLGELRTRSVFGGFASDTLGRKGNHKRLFKKAHEKNATHILFVEGTNSAWDSFVAGSAHAFNCNSRKSDQTVADVSSSQPRAVTEERKKSCSFIKAISTGAGGSGNASQHTEKAMNSALAQAAKAGADSYFVVNVDATEAGASVVLEALKCK